MTIFSRYVFRQTASALVIVLVSLTGIVWISLALRELNVVTGRGQSALTLLEMTTLGLPSFVAVITPFALLITAIHTLNRLASDSEIIVLTASGATAWTLTKPLVTLALVVMAFLSFLNHLAAPWSHRLLRDIVIEVRSNLLTQVIQPGRFSSPDKGLTFHIRERDVDGTLHGLIMHDERDAKTVQTFLAEKGMLVEDKGGTYLFMMDGHILRRDGGITEPTDIVVFDKYAVDLDSLEKRSAGEDVDLRPRERYFHELLATAPKPEARAEAEREDASKGKEKGRRRDRADALAGALRSELHERFSSILYPMAFVLMAVAGVGQAQSTRQNRHVRMGACFLAGVAVRLAGLAANNIVSLYAGAVPALYLIPATAIAVSLFLIVRGARPSSTPKLLDRLADAAAALAETVRERLPRRRRARAALAARS